MKKKYRLLIPAVVSLFTIGSLNAAVLPGYQSYNGYTNDVGPDLATVIEYDDTKAACDQYQADLDQYLIDNDATLSQISDVEASIAVLSDQEQYIVDNFVDTYDKETLIQCGKYQYFYGTFDTTGAPQAMMHWMLRYFDDYFGPGMSNFGMYEDPNPVATVPPSPYAPERGSRQLPVGIANSSGDFGSSVPVYAFTCAACHFKKQDDGNFAVGIGNTEYEYQKMISAQGQLPYQFLFQTPDIRDDVPDEIAPALLNAYVIPDVQTELFDPVATARAIPGAIDEWNSVDAIMNAGSTQADRDSIASTLDQQRQNWNTWSGVMDFMVPPMQDDGAFTITRILNLNSMVTDDKIQTQHGFKYKAGLGWHGGSYDIINFIRSFITITPSDTVNPESRAEYNYWVNEYRYMPLVRYLETFKEPELPTDRTFETASAKRGEDIFDRNCTSCHNGPGGETSRSYDHAEVKVEEGHLGFMDLYWDPALFAGEGGWETNVTAIRDRFPAGETGTYTRQIKAPRFISMWDNDRLLHNGSVRGLDELFTCASTRTSYATESDVQFSNQGHEFGCEYSVQDKQDLKTFIQTFTQNRNEGNKYNGQFDFQCQLRNDGTSQLLNLTFSKGKHMELMVKYYSDANCQNFDISKVNNPSVSLGWDMQVGTTFINTRGFESHNVTYTKPDGSIAEDVIALENGELANAEEGDPVPRAMYAVPLVDYAGLNGRWLNNTCTVDGTRGMVVIQDGVRVDKTVTYNALDCSGGVASVVNNSAWAFEDPKWLKVGTNYDTLPKYNMRLKMTSLQAAGNWTQFANVTDNTLHLMFNNYFAASINGNGQHYTRITNIDAAQ